MIGRHEHAACHRSMREPHLAPASLKFSRFLIGAGQLSRYVLQKYKKSYGKITYLCIRLIIRSTLEHNYYEFQVYRWNYLGKAMYGVSLKEAKTIK